MSATIQDLFKVNNVPYSELADDEKEKIDRLIELIEKDEDLSKRLKGFYSRFLNILTNTTSSIACDTSLPKDLAEPITIMYFERLC